MIARIEPIVPIIGAVVISKILHPPVTETNPAIGPINKYLGSIFFFKI